MSPHFAHGMKIPYCSTFCTEFLALVRLKTNYLTSGSEHAILLCGIQIENIFQFTDILCYGGFIRENSSC